MKEYTVSYFKTGEGSSGHTPVLLAQELNAYAGDGWRLMLIQPVPIGYLLVLERERK